MIRTQIATERMGPSRLAGHSARRQILKIVSGEPFDSARTRDDIWNALSANTRISYNSFYHHLMMLVKYGVVYEQYDYVREEGKIYSIYWSNEAQKVMQIAEGISY